jgi:hypothetical protein
MASVKKVKFLFTQEEIEQKTQEFFSLADSNFWYYARYITVSQTNSLANDITCRMPWYMSLATSLQKFEECDYDTNYFILNATVRLGKTTLGTILWATWLFGKDPKAKILIVTKQDQNKKKISQDIKTILTSDYYKALFPHVVILNKGIERILQKKSGVINFITSGSNVRGMGFDHIIIDDFLDKKVLSASSGIEKKNALDAFEILLTRKENSLSRINSYIKQEDRIVYDDLCISKNIVLDSKSYDIIQIPRRTKYYLIEQRLHPSDLTAYLLNKLHNTRDSNGQHVKYKLLTFPYEIINNPLSFEIYKLHKFKFKNDDGEYAYCTNIIDTITTTKEPGTLEKPNFIDLRFNIGTRLEIIGPRGINNPLYQTEYLCNPVLDTNKLIDYANFSNYSPNLFSGDYLAKSDRKLKTFFITTDFALSDNKKSDSSVFCLWAVTDSKHSTNNHHIDPKLYLITALVHKLNDPTGIVNAVIDFVKQCEMLIRNRKYFSEAVSRDIKHIIAENMGINNVMFSQLYANNYIGSKILKAKHRNKSKRDRLSIATAAIGDRIKQSVFLPKSDAPDVFGYNLQQFLVDLEGECQNFNVTNNSHDDIIDNVIDAVNYVFNYDKDVTKKIQGLTDDYIKSQLEKTPNPISGYGETY